MSAIREPKWKLQQLPIEDIRERPEHQVRVGGLSRQHVNTLARAMDSEGDLKAISVAKIGKAHYVVDGFHRLAAARKLGWSHISAHVAKMSAAGARDFALLANTKHGKGLGRYEKERVLNLYLAEGKHLGADGVVKACRVIAAEINYVYSHETIRQKLKKRGIEVDLEAEYPGGYKPRYDEADLALELAESAQEHLDGFGSLFFDLDDDAQRSLLGAARDLVGRLERGERPVRVDERDLEGLLDI